VAQRVPASARTGQQIEKLLREGTSGDLQAELIRLGVRRLVEEVLEAEASAALGRGYYERDSERREPGYRNGYRRGRLRTAEGALEYAAPQVSDREEPFRSRIREQLGKRSAALERLAVEMYARGLSTRDIEATLADEEGNSLLSKSAVSELTERLWTEYEAFVTRDLSEYELLYFYLDGLAERLRPGQPREAVLCAWGIVSSGEKVLLGLSPGTKEDTESCRAFIQDLRRRGLRDPLLTVTDGAPGLIRAVEECLPRSLRQRCLAHRMRNLESKVPEQSWPELRARARACYEAPSAEMARALAADFERTYQGDLPSAVACFKDDFEACLTHLRFPLNHRQVIRTTNLLERLCGEERRRTKVIANCFGERPVLKLMYAALIRASEQWRGITISQFERRQLDTIRQELDEAHRRRHAPAVKAAARKSLSGFSSTQRT